MGKNHFKTKGISFNVSDPVEKELYEYAMQHTNFSGFMKRILYKDLLEWKLRKNNQT